MPRRSGQSRGTADVEGAAGAHLRQRRRSRPGRSCVRLEPPSGDGRQGQGGSRCRLRAQRHLVACAAAPRALRAADRRARNGARRPGRELRAAPATVTVPSSASPARRAWGSRGWSRSSCARARRRGYLVPFGECQAYGTTSYRVWSEIWRRLLGVDDELHGGRAGGHARARAGAHRSLARRACPAARRAARDLDPGQRPDPLVRRRAAQDVPRGAARRLPPRACCRRAARPRARGLPLDRRALARPARGPRPRGVVARASSSLLAYRPAREVGGGLGLERLPHFSELALPDFERRGGRAADRLEAASTCSGRTRKCRRRSPSSSSGGAEGNPFYIEELLNYIQAQGVDMADASALARLELPDSLHSLILSRIDTLSEAPRRTLKVASVVGRSFFAPALPASTPSSGLSRTCAPPAACSAAPTSSGSTEEHEEAYIFKHVVTQEVTYESMPFAIRADLHERDGLAHRTVRARRRRAKPRPPRAPLLAQRERAEEAGVPRPGRRARRRRTTRTRRRSTTSSAPRRSSRASERWRVTRALGRGAGGAGDWPAPRPRTAMHSRSPRRAVTRRRRAGRRRRWPSSRASGATSTRRRSGSTLRRRTSKASDDRPGFGQGAAHPRHRRQRPGRPRPPAAHMEASLAIRREVGDEVAMGALYSNLAIVAEYEGDYERSCALHEEGLALRIEAGDTAGIAVSQMNLGVMLQRARPHGRGARPPGGEPPAAPRDRRPADDRPGRAQPGNPHARSGRLRCSEGVVRRARSAFSATRTTAGRSRSCSRTSPCSRRSSASRSSPFGWRAPEPALREETRAPHGLAAQEELDAQLAPAREALGERAEATWEAGSAAGLEAALKVALGFCEAEQ